MSKQLQVSLVAIEESFILVSGVHTSVPCDDTLEYDKSSSRVLILQVSLVVKIEVEVSSCTENCLQVCLVMVL